tara:strand:+ start:622 stop:879 length:258 start_codon:yes stop_codon:yes gene_type:complete
MAEYSKQYDEVRGMGFHDFDLMDEFNKCKSGYYLPVICEGFGSIGVMNDKGVCKLAFVDEDREGEGKGTPVIWKTLDEVKLKYKK